jgi:recombination protein RecA
MPTAAMLRAQIESQIPCAFTVYRPQRQSLIPTGIAEMDAITGGIPLSALTEICGSDLASSGKTTVLLSLLGRASQKHFCALVDSGDCFDPASAEAAGVRLPRLLWVRCGKSQSKLRPLEQAFKATDMLIQAGGFGLIVVDLSSIPERLVRNVPLTTWFRFNRVVEKLPMALVFIEQKPHATSCAALVLNLKSKTAAFSQKLFTGFRLEAEVLRTREKKPVQPVRPDFAVRTQWA